MSERLHQHVEPGARARTDVAFKRNCTCGNHTPGAIECRACNGKRLRLQRKPVSCAEVGEVPEIVRDVLGSVGYPLDRKTLAYMEPRFGRDFSHVRVHTDARAGESASAVGAQAYTVGRDMVFAPRRYAPTTVAGRALVAHELTHVVQQAAGTGLQRRLPDSEGGSSCEREASRIEAAVLSGSPLPEVRSHERDVHLRRKCDWLGDELAMCSLGVGRTIFDVSTSAEELFLFNESCELLPDYEEGLRRLAKSLPENTSIVVHGFSSDQEMVDYSCQRALTARQVLVDHGVSDRQIASLHFHSAAPGELAYHRSVVIERTGSIPVNANVTQSGPEMEAPRPAALETEEKRAAPTATLTQISDEYLGTGWSSVNKIGLVRVEEASAKVRGARLRRAASGAASLIHHLDENTKVFVIARSASWIYGHVAEGPHRGASGYIANHLVWLRLPDPESVLYYVAESNLGLQELVENHPQYADYDIKTGDDARSLVMAVLVANDEDPRTRGHVYLNQQKLKDARDKGTWEGIKDRSDEYRRVLRPILQSVELMLDKKIWLPSESYIHALKDSGLIPSRPEWKNMALGAAKAVGGFASGLVDGFVSSVVDMFIGVYDLVRSVISLVVDLISGAAVRSAKEIYDVVNGMSASEIFKLIKSAISGLISDSAREFTRKWTANHVFERWYFRGEVIGYVLAEILILIFSGGVATVTKWLGKLGRFGGKLDSVLGTVFTQVDKALDKVPGRRGSATKREDRDVGDKRGKARDLPAAVALASSIAAAHDAKDSPVSTALLSLKPLKRRYRWIDRFTAESLGPGRYKIVMIASRHVVEDDYTAAVIEEFAEAGRKGTVEDRPEGTHGEISTETQRVKFVHDRGVERGRIKAVQDGLTPNDPRTGRAWGNPYEFDGPFGRGIDDIMFDTNGDPVILEFKGGRAGLGKGPPRQMSKGWVCAKIRELKRVNDPMAVTLETAMENGRLKGRIYRTPVDGVGNFEPTYLDGDPIDFGGKC